MKTDRFDISGMSCAACVNHIDKQVKHIQGIQTVQVQLLSNSMTVTYDESVTDVSRIEEAVSKAGYGAKLQLTGSSIANAHKTVKRSSIGDNQAAETTRLRKRFWWSVAFWLPLFVLNMAPMVGIPILPRVFGHDHPLTTALVNLLFTIPVLYLNRVFFSNGFRSLFQASPTMDTLVAVGSSAAVLYGLIVLFTISIGLESGNWEEARHLAHALFFESATTILTLVTLGKLLESRSKQQTTTAVSQLMELTPIVAVVMRNDEEMEIPVEDVRVGDRLVVRPGSQIPVDGVVLTGSSFVDEAALTGESIPVLKELGDTVLSGSVNQTGFFTFEAVRVGEDATLNQIIRLVETATMTKAPLVQRVDSVSRWFVPVVLILGLLTVASWLLLGYPIDFALTAGIAVLVISCPCALGLATPVAVMVGTGRGARRGILFTSGDSLETAHLVSTVLLDKTGTVTTGKPVVTDVLVEPGFNEQEVLQMAASLETLTNHPFSVAILRKFQASGNDMLPVENFEAVLGKGVHGRINGQLVRVGNAAYLQDDSIFPSASIKEQVYALSETGKTPLFVAKENQLLGVIFVADTLRPGIKEAVERLLHAGKQVVMLTGDHAATAKAIAREAGISEVRTDLLPQDKERIVAEYRSKGQKVAMVGDGINDAPALASADVGIAMGAGTDIALSSADVVLMRNDLSAISDLFLLSRKVSATIKQNLFWAFFYNVLGIPLAAGMFYLSWGKLLNPEVAAAAMSLSSVTVVLNALRLNRLFRSKTATSNKPSDETVLFDAMNHSKLETPMKTTILHIEGMSCGHCSATVEKALNAFDGVKAYVDLTSNTATIYHPENLSTEELAKAVDNAGYKVV